MVSVPRSSALLPHFIGADLNILVSTVDYVQAAVRRELWSIERVEHELGKRTSLEILDDGTTFAYAPCPERTLVAAAIVLAHGIQPTVVYHERRVFGFGPSTAHFAIEVEIDADPYMLDFGTWETRLIPGGYYYAEEWEETLALDRIVMDSIDPESTSAEALVADRMTSHLDLRKKLEWYRTELERPRDGIQDDRIAFAKEFTIVNAV